MLTWKSAEEYKKKKTLKPIRYELNSSLMYVGVPKP